MKVKVSSTYRRFLTVILILAISILISSTFFSTTVSAQDGTGVGVLPVRARITQVEIEYNFGTQHLHFNIFDLNSWRHVSEVSVEFYLGEELVRHYVFNQTESLERSVEVRKGNGLIDFESNSSEKRETVEQRSVLSLHFQFSGFNYEQLTIRARDHSGGSSETTMFFQGITTGRPMTVYILPVTLLATAAIIFNTIKNTGGEIDGA